MFPRPSESSPALANTLQLSAIVDDGFALPSVVTKDVSAPAMDFSGEEIKERMSGSLCRCGAYVGICGAIRETFESGATR
jgi:aerobic-type carbon monoxide dehydrogenase small subunit (CoxS/CutS family)